MEYLYEYIYIAQDDNTTAVAWPKAGFLISTHTLFCVVGVVCVRCALCPRLNLSSCGGLCNNNCAFFVALDPDPALAAALACALD